MLKFAISTLGTNSRLAENKNHVPSALEEAMAEHKGGYSFL